MATIRCFSSLGLSGSPGSASWASLARMVLNLMQGATGEMAALLLSCKDELDGKFKALSLQRNGLAEETFAKFEELNKDLFKKVAEPIKQVLGFVHYATPV